MGLKNDSKATSEDQATRVLQRQIRSQEKIKVCAEILFVQQSKQVRRKRASQRYVWIGKTGAGRPGAGESPNSTNSTPLSRGGGVGHLHLHKL